MYYRGVTWVLSFLPLCFLVERVADLSKSPYAKKLNAYVGGNQLWWLRQTSLVTFFFLKKNVTTDDQRWDYKLEQSQSFWNNSIRVFSNTVIVKLCSFQQSGSCLLWQEPSGDEEKMSQVPGWLFPLRGGAMREGIQCQTLLTLKIHIIICDTRRFALDLRMPEPEGTLQSLPFKEW